MRYSLLLFIWLVGVLSPAQTTLPGFLKGTWKLENTGIYEQWDSLNGEAMKGVSWYPDNGGIKIMEYLDIARRGDDIIYTATVPGQNGGKGISFTMTGTDETVSFENEDHDFPRIITYHRISNSELAVELSDGADITQKYTLNRVPEPVKGESAGQMNPNYDPALAKKLGADDYGMKTYILVLLKTGPNKTTDQELISRNFSGHLSNINRLAEEGKLVVAGPISDQQRIYRGIYIFNLTSVEEATELLQTDPAVSTGLLEAEIYPWYGSAALAEYLKVEDKIWKLRPR
jgi:uncharacterized protein YciI